MKSSSEIIQESKLLELKTPNKLKSGESKISTPELKKIFYIEAKKYFKNRHREFQVDNENKRFLDIFCKYFSKDLEFEKLYEGELQKGLLIIGPHGTGKTSVLEIIQIVSLKYNIKQIWYPIKPTIEIVGEFNRSEGTTKDNIIQYYSKGKYLFDDLGAEKDASNYGKENIFERILELRYNNFKSKGIITHLTTNLTLKELQTRYGNRVFDRIHEMFNILELKGNSRRF
ncbi:hypothetical protein [Formosa sp. PL04]|uniref:hypothetical protein n=1 Tax=Formosa sp. PL04 TaxID=3081755 RepID=UPI002981CEF2|nr:hypothetical protein [Formosa sp. PL04]MDW5288860.1 hypothetical protein [Formosa sp. PL04]